MAGIKTKIKMLFSNVLLRPKTMVAFILGIQMAWFAREQVTALLFFGKGFEGRTYLIQMALFGLYSLFFTALSYLLLLGVERLSIRPDGSPPDLDELIKKQFGNLVLLAAILILLIYPLKYVTGFLSFPYPIEYREAATIYSAIDFSKGLNPYSLQNYPEHIYLYGFLYPLLLAPFINLVSHPLLAARGANVLFGVLFLGMSYWIFRKRKASIISALIGVLILLNAFCYIWKLNGARPDLPGLFFSFLGVCFLMKDETNRLDILLCAISCLIAFYFKQYLIFSALAAAVYLFCFVSKQKGYFFIATVSVLLPVTFFVMRGFFPLFFEYTILHHIRLSGTSSTAYMLNQTSDFIGLYGMLFILTGYVLHKRIVAFGKAGFQEIRLMIFDNSRPLLQGVSLDMIESGVIVTALILTFYLGRHDGNTFTYYGELLLPFLLYWIIPRIDELFISSDLHRVFILALILAFCIFPFREKYATDFRALQDSYAVLSRYADSCANIYDQTPLVAVYKIEHKMQPLYNSGQTEYAGTAIPDRDMFIGRVSVLPAELFNARLRDWNQEIHTNMINFKFDCIFSENKNGVGNYHLKAEIPDLLGRTVYLWVPPAP